MAWANRGAEELVLMIPSHISTSSSTVAQSPTTAAYGFHAPQHALQYEMTTLPRIPAAAITSAEDDVVSMTHVDDEAYTATVPNTVTTLSTLASVDTNEAHEIDGSRPSYDVAQVEGTIT
jgi:hypothetical protein